MSTVGELVRDISFRMHSYTGIREQVTYLTTPVDADDTTLQVANGARISRGLIEVEDELMLVETVEGNEVRIYPFGRGREGSTASEHLLNAEITNDPLLPKRGILQALQETCLQVHPDLFQVKSTDIVFSPAKLTYELPADVDRVLQVTYDVPGPTGTWPRLQGWSFQRSAQATEYASGKALDLHELITPGYKLHVTYAAPYGTPVSMDDTLASIGVQDSVREVLLLGTCWRLTQNLESSRLQMQSVESLARQQAVPPGSATNLAKQIYAMFQLRQEQERKRLLALHPQSIHRTR